MIFRSAEWICGFDFSLRHIENWQFVVQYNLDRKCPDSMLYRLERHTMQEHITYFDILLLKINRLVREIS